MRRNSKMLLGAMLASITSACVVPQAGDTPDREALDNDLVVPSKGGTAPEDHTTGVSDTAFGPAPTATLVNCGLHSIVDEYAYTGILGQAICVYGYTFVDNYLNQIHKFVIGTNYRVYHTWQNVSTLVAGGWEDLGGFATSGVHAGVTLTNALEICVVGSDGSTVYKKSYSPRFGWQVWTAVGSGGSFFNCYDLVRPSAF